MATQNIYNSVTGQKGYQVPGAALPTGWQWVGVSTPTPSPVVPTTPSNSSGASPVSSVGLTPQQTSQLQSIVNTTPGGQAAYASANPAAYPMPTTSSTPTNAGTTGTGTSGTPITPVTPSTDNETLKELLAKYTETLTPTSTESDLQSKIYNLQSQQGSINASRDLGIQAVNEQPIATPFLTGQATAITNRAAVQSGALGAQITPLQQQMALEQAKRQSSIDVTKAAFEGEVELAKLNQPTTLSAGSSLVDSSGNIISTTPVSKNLNTQVVEVNGRKLLVNTQTGETIQDLGAATNLGVSQTTINKNKDNDIASAILEFQRVMKEKGWRGINPDAYEYYKNEILKTYGASAVLEFDAAIKKAGLTVDYGQSNFGSSSNSIDYNNL